MIAALLLPITLAGCAHPAPYYPPPPGGSLPKSPAREGFRDGAAAARRDIATGLRPDAVLTSSPFARPLAPVPPANDSGLSPGF